MVVHPEPRRKRGRRAEGVAHLDLELKPARAPFERPFQRETVERGPRGQRSLVQGVAVRARTAALLAERTAGADTPELDVAVLGAGGDEAGRQGWGDADRAGDAGGAVSRIGDLDREREAAGT